jgi:hypothetical protein
VVADCHLIQGPDGEGGTRGRRDAAGGDCDGGAGEAAPGRGERGALDDKPGGHSCGARHGCWWAKFLQFLSLSTYQANGWKIADLILTWR